jgi:hypothetical protein
MQEDLNAVVASSRRPPALDARHHVELASRCAEVGSPGRFDPVMNEYRAQNELIYIEDFFSPELAEAMLADARRVQPAVSRMHSVAEVSGGHVTFDVLSEQAPAIVALYRSPTFRQLLTQLAGTPLEERHCALYYYDRPGDFAAYHYDPEGTFTALIGIVDQSTQVLDCHLTPQDENGAPHKLRIATRPRSLFWFRGSRTWHGVTEMGDNEERIVLSIQFNAAPPEPIV